MEIELQEQYQDIISEIRQRILSAEILSDERENVVFIESATLQIRKILELIAYFSLLLNKGKVNRKIREEYHAKRIINAISENTTIFYPFPSRIIPPNSSLDQPMLIPIGYKHALSQKEFNEVYQDCGKVLHAQHPFKNELDFKKYKQNNTITLRKLKNLLQNHTVGVRHKNNQL